MVPGSFNSPVYDFLVMLNGNMAWLGSFTRCKTSNLSDLDFDLQGHKLVVHLDSPNVTSYVSVKYHVNSWWKYQPLKPTLLHSKVHCQYN